MNAGPYCEWRGGKMILGGTAIDPVEALVLLEEWIAAMGATGKFDFYLRSARWLREELPPVLPNEPSARRRWHLAATRLAALELKNRLPSDPAPFFDQHPELREWAGNPTE